MTKRNLDGKLTIKTVKVGAGRMAQKEEDKKVINDEFSLRKRLYEAFLYTYFRDQQDDWSEYINKIANDHELREPYWLSVVYNVRDEIETAVVSCRFYTEYQAIALEIEGVEGISYPDPQGRGREDRISFDTIVPSSEYSSTVLIDRLSDITGSNNFVTKYRAYGLILRDIFTYSQATTLVGIARMEKKEPFLLNYVPMGIEIMGITKASIGGIDPPFKFWVMRSTRWKIERATLAMSGISDLIFGEDENS